MPRRSSRSRAGARLAGRRLARSAAASLGAQVLAGRKRRRWTQEELGDKVDLSPSRVGQIEDGDGAGASLEVWFALSAALDIPLRVEFGRDRTEQPLDAGHLGIQELVLRLGRETGRARTFELTTRPADPALSIDVGLRDDVQRVLIINECWNTFGNINASVRSTRRKIAEAEDLAAAIGGEAGPYRVAGCWIVRDTRRNREILGHYPEVFAATFTGSFRAWVRANHDNPVPHLHLSSALSGATYLQLASSPGGNERGRRTNPTSRPVQIARFGPNGRCGARAVVRRF